MITRRELLGGALTSAAFGKDQRPNVLFLAVDDMNDWVGCLGGYPGVRTPNIDALAKRGVLFRNTHCASPLCNPSRVALLTGLRPSTTGIYNNEQYWRPNLPGVISLPGYFKPDRYHTPVSARDNSLRLHHLPASGTSSSSRCSTIPGIGGRNGIPGRRKS